MAERQLVAIAVQPEQQFVGQEGEKPYDKPFNPDQREDLEALVEALKDTNVMIRTTGEAMGNPFLSMAEESGLELNRCVVYSHQPLWACNPKGVHDIVDPGKVEGQPTSPIFRGGLFYRVFPWMQDKKDPEFDEVSIKRQPSEVSMHKRMADVVLGTKVFENTSLCVITDHDMSQPYLDDEGEPINSSCVAVALAKAGNVNIPVFELHQIAEILACITQKPQLLEDVSDII